MLGLWVKRIQVRFQPGLLPSIVVTLLLPLLVGLGFWQLDRAQEKEALKARFQTTQTQRPIKPEALTHEPNPAFVRVQLTGHFDENQSYLLDSRTRNGIAGVELLQPFFDQKTQRWFLVNRGWLAWPDRTTAPHFSTPKELISISAWVYVPTGEPFVLKEQTTQIGDATVVSALRPQTLWEALKRTGYRYEMRLEPSPYALDTHWPQTRFNANTHRGYALQWFSLATALVALFIYFGLHHARENNNEPSLSRT